jgi:hypothetical protein
VTEICHGRPDHYYRCLLLLNVADLVPVLADMAAQGHNDSWFESRLKAIGCIQLELQDDEDINIGSGQEDELPGLSLQDLGSSIVGDDIIIPQFVKPVVHSRVKIDTGEGTPAYKVYFDNFSRQGNSCSNQRGFIDCHLHSCIKYRVIVDETVEYYCARAYLWMQNAAAFGTKASHLAWEATDADIVQVMPSLRLTPF